jgi:hypothetical protein
MILLLVALFLDPESFSKETYFRAILESPREGAHGSEGCCVDLLFHARHLFEANAKRKTPTRQGEAIEIFSK